MTVQGTAAPDFSAVRRAFEANFAERDELGAGVCVIHHGRVVVELWGGVADRETGRPWMRDTIVHVYSTTKPMVAACALILVDRGRLALDERVVAYWPEFGAHGKEHVTVRQLLSHQAGLVALRDPVSAEEIYDWDAIVARLAAERPWWEPGTAHGEHAYFYGHLVGELIRRVDGRPLRQFFAEEMAGPLGLDFQIGVRREDRGRVAKLVGLDRLFPNGRAAGRGDLHELALGNPPGMLVPEVVNSDRWMDAEVPAVNGWGTAAAIARFYAMLLGGGTLDGRRVLSEAVCREATSVQSSGWDAFVERDVDWGLGLQIENGQFGHGGLGGSGGYADPKLELAMAYVTNRMSETDRSGAPERAAEEAAAALARAD